MSILRVKQAASCRGIYFDGIKKWINNVVGYGYEIYTNNGFKQSDTLKGIYKIIMEFPKN